MASVFKGMNTTHHPTSATPFGHAGSLLLGVLCLLASCLPEPLEVKDVPTIQPEIVVASQMIPGQGLVILLTRTFGALDASDDSDPASLINQIAINDAVVFISGPTGAFPLIPLGYGLYGGIQIPFQAGETYELLVNSPAMGKVSATTTVQAEARFESIEAELYYTEFDDSVAQITYSLQDPPEQNWYMINVQEVEQEDIIQNLINPRAFTRLLEDREFDAPLYQEQFRVFPRDYAPGDTIAVSISSVSEEYYSFLKLRMDNRFSFVEFIGEPINYPTNIVGGRGYFNLYLPDVRVFVLEEPQQ